MAELADAIDLGSIVSRRAGSSPVIRMKRKAGNSRILRGFPAFFGGKYLTAAGASAFCLYISYTVSVYQFTIGHQFKL